MHYINCYHRKLFTYEHVKNESWMFKRRKKDILQKRWITKKKPGLVISWTDLESVLFCATQSFVVAEAYDYSPDWAEILYQKVILKGDFSYLEEFKLHRPLPASLFEEISKK